MMDGQHSGVNNYCFIIKATMKYADMHIADSVIFSFLLTCTHTKFVGHGIIYT